MIHQKVIISLLTILISVQDCYLSAQSRERDTLKGGELFISLISSSTNDEALRLVQVIDKTWETSYEIMTIETVYILQNPLVSLELINLLQDKTSKRYGYNFSEWYKWLWNKKEAKDKNYGNFKSYLHKKIDPKFDLYFKGRNEKTTIRLDEVRWGGVVQDGIPPLRSPEMINVSEAAYLEDNNIVFGIEVNGDVRAYPKRILAWHEMFVDEVGVCPWPGFTVHYAER